MADENDLVSEVKVEGTEAAAAKLEAYANRGANALERLDKAAGRTSKEVTTASQEIETAASRIGAALAQVARQRIAAQAVPDLQQIERSTRQLVAVVRSAVPAITSFVARLTAAGTGAAAAGVGILKLASNVVKASSAASNAIEQQSQAQQEANNAALQGQLAAINLEGAQRQLYGQFQRGEISFTDYSKALQALNRDFDEQQRVAREVAFAQETVRLENERLQKQAANTAAYQSQIDIFGGPLLSSLLRLGTAANALFRDFQQTFGPAVSQGIDLISNALATNGSAISAFFSSAAQQVSTFISQNGPAIQTAFVNIGNAIKTVFEGILAALPGLLNFFNNSLVPAIQTFGSILNGIAAVINKVFGTELTGGAILFLTIIGQMTGSFIALIQVLRIAAAAIGILIGLPFGPVILAIAAAIGVLLFVFPQLRQVALDVLNSIIQAFVGVANGARASVQGVIAAWNGIVGFFTGLFKGIAQLFADAWTLITEGATAGVQSVIDVWNAIVAFFQNIITQITSFFQQLWTGLVNGFTTAVDTVKGIFNQLLATAKAKLQPILDLLQAIASLAASATGGSGAAGAGAFAGGGAVRGPGTGTSDSIPAWLSDGEFVIKAKSVAKYGTALLHAINSGRFRMPRFNVGGLVSSMIRPTPRFAYADGGEVVGPSSMRPINLSLFGEEFNGLLAPEDVGDRLTKFAVARQTRSTGRKPAWLGRGRN